MVLTFSFGSFFVWSKEETAMKPSKASQNSGSRKDMAFSKFFSATAVETDRVFLIRKNELSYKLG